VRDVEVSVLFKPVDGEIDQAVGLIARGRDTQNYYVVRANALEANVRLYKVVDGVRRQIAGHNIEVTTGIWHSLSLRVTADKLEASFDGVSVLSARDETFGERGKPVYGPRRTASPTSPSSPSGRSQKLSNRGTDMSHAATELRSRDLTPEQEFGLIVGRLWVQGKTAIRAFGAWFLIAPKLPEYSKVDYSQEPGAARAVRLRRIQAVVDDLLAPPGPDDIPYTHARF
jgi:hypothetical protein